MATKKAGGAPVAQAGSRVPGTPYRDQAKPGENVPSNGRAKGPLVPGQRADAPVPRMKKGAGGGRSGRSMRRGS